MYNPEADLITKAFTPLNAAEPSPKTVRALKRTGDTLKSCIGYLCATAIVIAMLLEDGTAALVTAGAVACTLAGVDYYLKKKG